MSCRLTPKNNSGSSSSENLYPKSNLALHQAATSVKRNRNRQCLGLLAVLAARARTRYHALDSWTRLGRGRRYLTPAIFRLLFVPATLAQGHYESRKKKLLNSAIWSTFPQCRESLALAPFFVVVTFLSLACGLCAQAGPCFQSDPALPWAGVDVGLDTPGASRPLADGGGSDYELCSAGAGFGGMIDSFRFLTQPGDGDVTLLALLESIEPSGAAGLMVRRDERDPSSAHVRILVTPGPPGMYELRSAARLEPGATTASEQGAPAVIVSLPLLLKIERRGNTITTYHDSPVGFTKHHSVDISGSDLEGNRLKYGMAQSSKAPALATSARFRRATLTEDAEPAPGIDCFPTDFAVPANGDTELTLRGTHLNFVTAATVAGQPARILERTSTSLKLHVPPFGAARNLAPQSGDIVLETGHRTVVLANAIVFAGRSFIRGDANSDNLVDLSDGIFILSRLFLGGLPLECPEAGDTNDDDIGDLSDAVFLFQSLFLGGRPIPPPYPKPGQSPGSSYPCGIPSAPIWEALTLADGAPIGATDILREGDVVIFRLRGSTADPQRLTVLFGDTPTEVLPRSTADNLHLRIGAVPTSGRKCPLLFESIRVDDGLSSDPDSELTYRNERGITLAADPTGAHTESCPRFEVSADVLLAGTSEPLAPAGRRPAGLLLRFDRARWSSLATHHLELRIFPPLLSRGSRGPRLIGFDYFSPPPLGFHGSPDGDEDFARWLKQLARRIDIELAGGDPRAGGGGGPCDNDLPCEDVEVEARPLDNGVAMFPCGSATDLAPFPNGPGPDPQGPGPGTKLKAPEPPLWSGTDLLAKSPCEQLGQLGSRELAWCRLAEVTREHVSSGLPKWEHWAPRSAMFNPVGLNETKQPPERPVGEKAILFNLPAFLHFRFTVHYNIPCVPTQNFLGCNSGLGHWMTSFPRDAMVMKTFWRGLSYLPASADPDDYYSYQPPGKEREYLVGLHLNTKDPPGELAGTGSWLWATFFVPPPQGDVLDKGGRPLTDRYNTACGTGHRNDMPADIQGVWRNFVLCTDTEGPESHKCGNPWGPKDECQDSTCNGCHTVRGQASYPESLAGMSTHQFQWMATLKPTAQAQQDCYEMIRALIDEGKPSPYEVYMNPACKE